MRRFPIRTFVSEGLVGKFGPEWVSGWWDAVETDDRSDFTHWPSISQSRKWQLKGVEEKSNNPGQKKNTRFRNTSFSRADQPKMSFHVWPWWPCSSRLPKSLPDNWWRFSFSSNFCFRHNGLHPSFFCTLSLSIFSFVGFYPHTQTHSIVIVFMHKRCKKSNPFLKCLCIPTTLLQLSIFDAAVPVETFDIEWSGWVGRWMLKVIVVTWVLSVAKKY